MKPVGDTGDTYKIEDTHLGFKITIPTAYLHNERFNIANWYAKMLRREYQWLEREVFWLPSDEYANCDVGCLHTGSMLEQLAENVHAVETTRHWVAGLQHAVFEEANGHLTFLEVNGVRIQRGTHSSIQRTAAQVRDPKRKVPKPILIVAKINGHPCKALLDSGFTGDFVSPAMAQQLGLKRKELTVPLPLQMACQGS